MIIPKNESRKFKLGKMSNKIKYILVHNKNIDQSQICVSVKVGSSMDPPKNMGLAHFLEHMLFLGNKKYPKEDFFDSHVKKYGGYSNAYTDTFETVYFFQCNNNGIKIAADCFSEFFKTPLFNKSSVKREINAINSEHSKNLKQDIWRLFHFIHISSKKDSYLNKFYTGNLDSFNDNVRNDMLEFYNKYYVSENLTIAIQSNLSFDKMEKLLDPFRTIPNKKSTKFDFSLKKPLFEKINTLSHLESTSDNFKMVIHYEIDYTNDTFKSLSHSIVSDLLNLNDEKSLRQTLINKKLVSEFYAFYVPEGIMYLYFELYDIDYKNIATIVNLLKKYISYLVQSPKLNDFIEESKHLYQIIFDNSEIVTSIDILNKFASNLHFFKKKYFYSVNSIIFDDIESIKKSVIKNLKSFKYHKIILYHKKNLDKMNLIDKPYNMKYLIDDYNKIKLKKEKSQVDFKMNTFGVTEPQLLKVKNIFKPIIKNNLFYLTNRSFKEPVVYLKVYYKLPQTVINDVNKFVNLKLMLEYLNEIISIKLHRILKINTNIYFTLNLFSSRIILNIFTFNNLLTPIFDKIDEIISDKKYNKIIFNKVKKNLIDNYLSLKNATPWNLMSYLVQNSFYDNIFSIDNILKGLEKVNKIKMINLSKLENYAYLVGNFDSKLLNLVTKKYQSNVTPEKDISENFTNKTFNISKKLNQICYSHNYILGKYDNVKNPLLLLLVNILESKFYHVFRTQKQYGYLVGANISKTVIKNNVFYGLSLKIQTEKNISNLKKELLDFVENLPKLIDEIDLATYQRNLLIRLQEPIKNTSGLFDRFNNQILHQTYNFDRIENTIKTIKKITKKQLVDFINNSLINQTPIIYKVTK